MLRQFCSRIGKKLLYPLGYTIQPLIKEENIEYSENVEAGCINISIKKKRLEQGGPFEWPNMVSLNLAIIQFIDQEKSIVTIGSGTGTFEWYAAEKYPNVKFISSEFDEECVEWCKKNRSRENITYTSLTMNELIFQYKRFDLAVCVDVIEHINDYPVFLNSFSGLANYAIISTPNKARDFESYSAKSPKYYQHVREWTAGEFYWILRVFYDKVSLYAMPDPYEPEVKRIGILSKMTPLIAVCEGSRQLQRGCVTHEE